MKYYLDGRLLFVDMITPYRFAVLEGDKVITCQQNRAAAEEAAADRRAWRDRIILQFEAALRQDAVTRSWEPKGFIREIWNDYQCQSEIAAAIRRMRRTRDSIRVVPLDVRQ